MSTVSRLMRRPTRPDLCRLLIMGPPGAGKGTQAESLVAHLSVPAISTGDIFRSLQTAETALAVRVRGILASGGFVDDETTSAILGERLAATDCVDGFLLDGYPRTLAQVGTLDEILSTAGQRLDAVLCLNAAEDELVDRLLRRGHEQGRVDDTEQTIRIRLSLYAQQTAPLIDTYRQRGLLAEVDGLGAVEEVTTRIHQALTRVTAGSRPTALG